MPDKVNYLFAFNLTPEDAITYFRTKGYAFSWNWEDVWQEEHSHAFTVAKMMQLDLLMDTRKIVDEFNAGNIDYKTAYKQLEFKLRAKGWWGKQQQLNPTTGEMEEVQLGSPWRVKRILETNMTVAHSAAMYETQKSQASFAPYWQYIDQDDARVRVLHHKVGTIFKNAVLIHSHPFWNKWYPPNDWGCRCYVRHYTLLQVKIYGLTILEDIPDDIGEPAPGWGYIPGQYKPDLSKYPQQLINKVGLQQ